MPNLKFADPDMAQITVKDLDPDDGYYMTIRKNNKYDNVVADFIQNPFLCDIWGGTFADEHKGFTTSDGATFYPCVEIELYAAKTEIYNFVLYRYDPDTGYLTDFHYYSVPKDETHTLTPGCAIMLPSLDSWTTTTPFVD